MSRCKHDTREVQLAAQRPEPAFFPGHHVSSDEMENSRLGSTLGPKNQALAPWLWKIWQLELHMQEGWYWHQAFSFAHRILPATQEFLWETMKDFCDLTLPAVEVGTQLC